MIALILGLVTAISYAGQSIVGKRLKEDLTPESLVFFTFAPAVPLLILFLFPDFSFTVNPEFFPVLALSFLANILAWRFFYQAIGLAPVGLVMPVTALTPLFILPVEFIMFGVIPKGMTVAGIILAIAGMVILLLPHQLQLDRTSLKGVLTMLITSIIWSFSATIEKLAVQYSHPVIYGISIYTLMAMYFGLRMKARDIRQIIRQNRTWIIILGIFSTLMALSQYTALLLTNVAIVIMLKRSGVLLSVIGGRWLFKEKYFGHHLNGSILILLGILVISLAVLQQ